MSQQVIYRKYRSKNFAEIIGQDHVVSILTQSILTSNISHGYLFCGPRGTGKTSLARLLAKAVNCDNFAEKKDVCNECPFCKIINGGESMDIIEMDAASNRGIEEIRSMRDTVNYMPTTLKKKVYIIDEAHMLTKEAFNALLKTLEEPPEHVIFILATTEPHKLPITILSRVQRYDLSLASEKDLSRKITNIISQEDKEIDSNSLKIIFLKSGGSFRDAESILGKILSSTSKKKITADDLYETLGILQDDVVDSFLDALLSFDSKEALELLNKMYEKSGSAGNIIDQSIERLRDKMVKNIAKLDKNIYNLANLLINLKVNLKDFNDKISLIEIEILNFCNSNRMDEPKPSQPFKKSAVSRAEKSADELPAQPALESKAPETIKSKNKIETLTDFLDYIVVDSKLKFPRLKSAIESSKVEIKEGIIIITNQHKFNIIYLQKKEVLDYLKDKARLIKANDVRFEVDESLVIEENQPKVNNILKVEVEENQESEPASEVVDSVTQQEDNTGLVELLL